MRTKFDVGISMFIIITIGTFSPYLEATHTKGCNVITPPPKKKSKTKTKPTFITFGIESVSQFAHIISHSLVKYLYRFIQVA